MTDAGRVDPDVYFQYEMAGHVICVWIRNSKALADGR